MILLDDTTVILITHHLGRREHNDWTPRQDYVVCFYYIANIVHKVRSWPSVLEEVVQLPCSAKPPVTLICLIPGRNREHGSVKLVIHRLEMQLILNF